MVNNVKNKKKKKGFTLIELIIVIAIIAILAAIAIPKFGEVRRNANISADIANAKQIQNAVSTVIADGTVKLPASDLTFTFDGTTEGADTIEPAIKEQLQEAIPKLKAVNANNSFVVKVTTKGTVTISTATTNGVEVYPNGTGEYAGK